MRNATFAMGSFWGAEAAFVAVSGVVATQVGYMRVGEHADGECEVVQLTYDPEIVDYEDLLARFWRAHDATVRPEGNASPTTRFRSVVFSHDAGQETTASRTLSELQAKSDLPLCTEIVAAGRFTPASPADQQYLERHGAFAHRGGAWPSDTTPGARGLDSLFEESEAARCLSPFGAVFTTPVFPELLELFVLRERTHLHAATAALASWFGAHGADGSFRSYDVSPILRTSATVHLSAATTIWTVSRPSRQLVFAVNLRPGEYLSRPDQRSNMACSFVRSPALNDQADVKSGSFLDLSEPDAVWVEPPHGPVRDRDGRSTETWSSAIPDAAFDVGCEHLVRWTGGRLAIEVESEILDRERVIRALGGHDCLCPAIEWILQPRPIAAAWSPKAFVDWEPLLDHWSGRPLYGPNQRGVAQRPRWGPDGVREIVRQTLPSAQLPNLDNVDPNEVKFGALPLIFAVHAVLARMPLGLQTRWLLAALAYLAGKAGPLSPDERAILDQALFATVRGSVFGSLWQWCRSDPRIQYLHLDIGRALSEDSSRATGEVEGGVARVGLDVPFSWLFRVWSREVAVVRRYLVLDAAGPADADTLHATVAAWERPAGTEEVRLVTSELPIKWTGRRWVPVDG